MEITLSSKWLKAFNGLVLLVVAILLMTCSYMKLSDLRWLIGLVLMLGACVLAIGWYAGAKKDGLMIAKACFYVLFAIVFFTKKHVVFEGYFFALWAMLEGALLFADGLKAKEESNDSWMLTVGVGALAIILGFVAMFTLKSGAEIVEEAFLAELRGAFSYHPKEVEVPEPKMSIVVGISFLAAAVGNIFAVLGQIAPKVEIKK